jgi:hypothetical protein
MRNFYITHEKGKTKMNKPKTLIIRFDEKTHKPKYIGTATPTEDDYSIIENIYGDPMTIIEPVYVKDCKTCELNLAGKCDPTKNTDTDNCPFDKEEEKQ